ncbi:hypothetical protein [Jannaschia sp. W003]|uniref:hypothetical protein n=1 Tax=Jannaschia sp. W003 TaxID=2867012 RepID=UPI0021A8896A|nr:hypothetical protein [Jannaschia sp. W003]UWQ22716.1 hypothetical protein K3554_06740 [Jannaschia sp. W003]
MTMSGGDPDPADAVARALDALPWGTFRGRSLGHEWIVSRTRFNGGASEKVVARALGAEGYVSTNLYRLARGPALRPCEMPADDVVRFVLDLVPCR